MFLQKEAIERKYDKILINIWSKHRFLEHLWPISSSFIMFEIFHDKNMRKKMYPDHYIVQMGQQLSFTFF